MNRGVVKVRRQWNWRALRLMVMVISSAPTFTQAQPAADPSFSAASIKLNRSGNNGRQSMTRGRISFNSVSIKECIMAAYDLRNYQVAGPPSLSLDRFDIAAAAEGPASSAELRAMLKTLLADRFKLRVHVETRELAAYRLITTKNGPKLARAVTDQPGSYALDGGSVVFHAMSMSAFADYLSRRGPIDRPVIDGTGIDGVFDFRLKLFEVRPDMPLNELKRAYYEWDQGSSIFTDLQEQLGMKLQPEKVPLNVMIVDSVAKPSEN
jgi:uncharacterized protein (TIGR03435 family)